MPCSKGKQTHQRATKCVGATCAANCEAAMHAVVIAEAIDIAVEGEVHYKSDWYRCDSNVMHESDWYRCESNAMHESGWNR